MAQFGYLLWAPVAYQVILGQNEKVTWGATTNPMDVTDLFADTLIVFTPECQAASASGVCIESDGTLHPVEVDLVQYRANRPGDGILDNVTVEPIPLDQRFIFTVPFRSFGPVVFVDDPSVLFTGGTTTAWVLQFTGFHATREGCARQRDPEQPEPDRVVCGGTEGIRGPNGVAIDSCSGEWR